METTAKVCKVLLWVVLIVGLLLQIMSVMGIADRQVTAAEGYAPNNISIPLIVIPTVIMAVAVPVFVFLRKGKVVPLIIAAVMAVCFILLAHYINVKINGTPAEGVTNVGTFDSYGYASLTVGKILYRHALLALEPLLMLPIWLVYRDERRAAEAAAEREEVPSILDGVGDFRLSKLSEEDSRPEPKRRKR